MHWVSIESREEEDIQWFLGWFARYFFREKNRREREDILGRGRCFEWCVLARDISREISFSGRG